MAFSHANHMKEELECVNCHRGAKKSDMAGFPRLKGCMLCHKEAKGKHPDEPKVRDHADEKREIQWVVVNANVGHVYFSHAAHVTLGNIACKDCHGNMKDRTEIVTRRTPELHSMSACMDCHEKRNASNDCLVCHK